MLYAYVSHSKVLAISEFLAESRIPWHRYLLMQLRRFRTVMEISC